MSENYPTPDPTAGGHGSPPAEYGRSHGAPSDPGPSANPPRSGLGPRPDGCPEYQLQPPDERVGEHGRRPAEPGGPLVGRHDGLRERPDDRGPDRDLDHAGRSVRPTAYICEASQA